MPLKPEPKFGQDPEKVNTPASFAKLESRLDELEILLRQNIQWSEVLYKDTKKIRRRLFTIQLWGWFKFALLLAPIILGAIFLPPYYREAKEWYQVNIEAPQQKIETNLNKFLDYMPKNDSPGSAL